MRTSPKQNICLDAKRSRYGELGARRLVQVCRLGVTSLDESAPTHMMQCQVNIACRPQRPRWAAVFVRVAPS